MSTPFPAKTVDPGAVDNRPVAHLVVIHLADNEYGNEKMDEVAQEYFRKHPDIPNLIVDVREHGGWWLQYARCGTVVGTANDAALFGPNGAKLRAQLATCRLEYLGSIRR